MDEVLAQLDDGRSLAEIDAAVDALTDDRLRLPTDGERLALLLASVRVVSRLQVWQQRLAAQIEASEAAWREHGTSATSWLAEAARLTPREARRMIRCGEGLERFPTVAEAAGRGDVLASQAESVTAVLAQLPEEFPAETVTEGEALMVEFAQTHNAAELRRLSSHLVEVLSPETADALEAKRAEEEHRRAMANRYLYLGGDGQGSMFIRGSLPKLQGESLAQIIEAYVAEQKRALDALDPLGPRPSIGMRRADALVALLERHAQRELAPTHGGDRPRVVVTLSWDELVALCAGQHPAANPRVRLLGTGELLSPRVGRQLLCDADVLPVVLGGGSQPLDVGRAQRLVTPAIRAALELRDRGCVFPGCDVAPRDCHAHHIVPWWAGGMTALWNLVLVCPHHHGIVEPGHDPAADRWQVRLRDDGTPEVLPPRRVDRAQRARLHARFHARCPDTS